MTLEEILEKRKRSAVAVFHRFRLAVAKGNVRTVFVEGFADKFYYTRFLPDGRFEAADVRITFGKRNMDRIIQWFYAEDYGSETAIFIRDSDFDRWLGSVPTGDHVFITCGYSVENYICSAESLRRFFEEVFCVEPGEIDIAAEVGRFTAALQRVFTWMAPLIGAILWALREDGRTLELDALPITPVFRAALEGGDLPEVAAFDYAAANLEAGDFRPESAELGEAFCQQGAYWWMRGHFLTSFAGAYLEFMYAELNARRKAGEIEHLNRTISGDFSPAGTLERLASLSAPTDRLLAAFA